MEKCTMYIYVATFLGPQFLIHCTCNFGNIKKM